MDNLTKEENNANEITSQLAEVSTQNAGLQSSESTPENTQILGSQSTGDSDDSKVNSQSQTFELEELHFTAEQILALAKHNENYTSALNETVAINNDISALNESIVAILKRVLYNKKRIESIK